MLISNPRHWSLVATAISVAFVFLALTFGMSEWKASEATAAAPATTTVR